MDGVSRRSLILILGFKRFERISQLLDMFSNLTVSIKVSVDRDESEGQLEQMRALNNCVKRYSTIEFKVTDIHLGLAKHFEYAINEAFKDYENVLVIEDDVGVTEKMVFEILQVLSRRLPQEIASLCLFPGLPGKFASVFDRNYWRYSDYFCPWGFALQKEDWSDFELALRAETIDDFHRSSFYGNLSRRRKKTWDYRIQKIQSHSTHTYDTQIQVIASSKEKKHLSPLFRSSRNNGFGDGYATNTKSHRPWWFLGGESSLGFGSFYIKNRLTCEILSFWDSLTVGGDRKFPNKAKLLFYWFNSRKSSQRFN